MMDFYSMVCGILGNNICAILSVTCNTNKNLNIIFIDRLQYCTLVDFDDDSDVEVEKDADERSQQEGTATTTILCYMQCYCALF